MNSEIQRLTNLRNFFIAKREACEEEIRLQQSQVILWTESADEVAQAIDQAEKEQKLCPTSSECIPGELMDKTFTLHHCPSIGFQINTIGEGQEKLDGKPIGETKDRIGLGHTIAEAVRTIMVNPTDKEVPPEWARCKTCGCVYPADKVCHCQKTRPAIAIRCTKCGCNIGAGHEGRCADHA